MRSNLEVIPIFFHDLKKFNATNFKSVATADLSKPDATTQKAFSSIITRFFIFKEKHSEISDSDCNMIYYKLKLDLIAKYFKEYPDGDTHDLVTFQTELNYYLDKCKGVTTDDQQSA